MYDELLKLFTSKDEIRPQFCQPNTQDGIVYATDTHSLIAIDAKLCNQEYPAHSNLTMKFIELLEKFSSNQYANILCSAITDALEQVELVDDIQRIDCSNEECEDGQVFCPACEHSHDCDSCHGVGHYIKIIGQIPDRNANLEMRGVIFAPHLLQRLVTVAEIMKKPIQWVHQSNTGNAFEIGNTRIIIMTQS